MKVLYKLSNFCPILMKLGENYCLIRSLSLTILIRIGQKLWIFYHWPSLDVFRFFFSDLRWSFLIFVINVYYLYPANLLRAAPVNGNLLLEPWLLLSFMCRLSKYSHQIFAWCQSHSISFARYDDPCSTSISVKSLSFVPYLANMDYPN